MVSIDAFQALDLGSIPGRRIEYFLPVFTLKKVFLNLFLYPKILWKTLDGLNMETLAIKEYQ